MPAQHGLSMGVEYPHRHENAARDVTGKRVSREWRGGQGRGGVLGGKGRSWGGRGGSGSHPLRAMCCWLMLVGLTHNVGFDS